MAKNVRFNVKCLVVPAGEPLLIELVNRDSVNHNVSIYTLEFASAFTGDIAYPAERFRYKVPALEAGQYLFQCDIHPRDMEGPLIVQLSPTSIRVTISWTSPILNSHRGRVAQRESACFTRTGA